MDNLFEIARKGNVDKFVDSCKERVACVAKHRIDENGNPFHIAASKGFLLSALQKIIKDLEESTRVEVEKAKDWEEVKRLEKELKNNKKYIKEALLDKSYIKDNKAVSPLYFLDPSEQKEVKQIADIKCGFICNKKFHICLYIVGAIVCAYVCIFVSSIFGFSISCIGFNSNNSFWRIFISVI
ncbi:ankyrin repeat domain-containing protein [Wolbachia endosymbiont (group B) of Pyrgus malvae]|uniref:ankyrin repeat domain-containing protein n=1 Tax=Wolbachia endosymbiont (group B) of Pyrgus malvae TaxID=2954052 RepID=UPI002226BE59|nr:ankyrin repeat domain-containing protein [Wolbachia endosymbiont (group B) of Pyrgus malvae]